jgi:ribosomal protein S18 acetylase RimI-like enzyme
VTALAVHPAAQGTGVGRRLIEEAERHFVSLGLERVEVTSGLIHRPAYDFYRHLGYEDHGLRFAKRLAR